MNKIQVLINEAIDDCMRNDFMKIDDLVMQAKNILNLCDVKTEDGLKKFKKADGLKTFLIAIRKYFMSFEKLTDEQLKYIDRIYLYGRKKYVDPTNPIEYYPAPVTVDN